MSAAQVAVDGISFDVRAGEMLGIAGVQGNGQTELVEALTGLRPAQSGQDQPDWAGDHAMPPRARSPSWARPMCRRTASGMAWCWPSRSPITWCLNTYYQPPFAKGVVLQQKRYLRNCQPADPGVRYPHAQRRWSTAGSLSGGNQQKVIVAREFSRPIKLLVASQPTRGLDVGSIEYIHRRIVEKRDEGCAVLLVSSELDEIMELSDRIAVMYRGKIVDVLSGRRSDQRRRGPADGWRPAARPA